MRWWTKDTVGSWIIALGLVSAVAILVFAAAMTSSVTLTGARANHAGYEKQLFHNGYACRDGTVRWAP